MHLGIDLGTTYSLIARVDSKNTPVLFPDLRDANQFRTRSVVALTSDNALVGQSAEDLLEELPNLEVIRHVKLQMGNPTPVFRDSSGNEWSPECISALILTKLLRDARAYTDEPIEHTAIAVPANFSEQQRRATLAAAHLAGLSRVSLIEEPVAAAIFYGSRQTESERTTLVYDLGGGTFDATVLRATAQGLFVLATDGTSRLGGKDIDEAIMEQMAAAFIAQTGFDPLRDRAASQQLRKHSEAIKIKLSQPTKSKVETALLVGGRTLNYVLTRNQLDKLTAPLLAQSLEICQQLLERANLSWRQLDEVILVGGSTMLPAVSEVLRKHLPEPANSLRQHLPHMAIAYGAALNSAASQGGLSGVPSLRQGSSRWGLGFRTLDPKTNELGIDLLIPPHTPIPVKKSTSYQLTRPDQTRLILEVVQVDSDGLQALSLGHLAFRFNQPPNRQPINVTLAYDAQGLISVTAQNEATGERAEQQFLETSGKVHEPIQEQQELLARTTLIH